MKEPNLEGMIEYLSEIGKNLGQKEDDSIATIMMDSCRDVSKEVQQIIYFTCKDRACSTQDEISRISNKDRQKNVFSAVIALYPLTKSLIIEMIKKADVTPVEFLEIYDANGELLNTIKTNIELIKNSSKHSQVDVNNYFNQMEKLQKEVAELEKTRSDLEQSIEGYKENIKTRNKLKKEIEELEKMKEAGIDKEIELLTIEKNRLEVEKKEKQQSKNKLKKEIEKVTEELETITDNVPKGYQDALDNLQKCMKELSE